MRTLVVVVLLGLLAGLMVGVLGAPGLITATVVLVGAVVFRMLRVLEAGTIAMLVPLTSWTAAAARCEPTFGRTCDFTDAEVGLLAWAAGLLLVALTASLMLERGRRLSR
jgi:hypothetical protein